MRFNDAVIGVAAIIVGLLIFIHVQSFPSQAGGRPGPALFPATLAALLMIAGVVLVVQGHRAGGPLCQIPPELNARGVGNIMMTLGAIVFYVLVSEYLGFLLASFVVMVGMMLMLKARARIAIPVAAGTTLCIYAIFHKMLMVPLPRGLLAF
ncbi:MAG: tripartite tricarboxylate transporter TctB family protein [Deltaproteobacteria bacterium]|jgi:putative tricarboxylic transport membrane protein|nr:tripartite tricarboxylate transporter TctB family protein [Deltaproteobacteria bacterium]